ncbi:hypothetical protein BAY59_10585 [Prauserella coralliicola]|nr:hypothetical protein BAY59_10585 [Prauserella coralliicola]
MRRLGRFFSTLFGMAVLGCSVLAGWALWTGGVFDGAVAKELRGSSVYIAPGVELDEAAAERIIGNRRLTVAFLEPGADLREACHSTSNAANGTVMVPLSREADEYDRYPCTHTTEDIGTGMVIESMIVRGIDQFRDEPLEALKVMAVNYDQLVRAEVVPDGARTISPSLPRYLIAAAAIGAVVAGAAVLYFGARKAGKLEARRRERLDAADDARTLLGASAAVLAQQIIDLDSRYARLRRGVKTGMATSEQRQFLNKYRKLVADYTKLLPEITTADESRTADLAGKIEALIDRSRALARLDRRLQQRTGRSAR